MSFFSGLSLSLFSTAAERASASQGRSVSGVVFGVDGDMTAPAETEESDFLAERSVGGGGGGIGGGWIRPFGCGCCWLVGGSGNGLVSGVRVSVLTVRYCSREADFH